MDITYLQKIHASYLKGSYNVTVIMTMLAQEGYCPELAHDGQTWFFLISGIEVTTEHLQPTIGEAILTGLEILIDKL